ncbi:hypothetical protein CC86DRAFT_367091 [Ophiobolus disseminans]|uniref:F-box domain-containing protein n=1 Tax=Ophiobolus disseminans TaxID=1469910 RepID=A0A6A7ACF9_9PLEO|nr:hypothetical protein CC86DRAFT_367091 [Ophiobolus disseminans]
MDHMTPLPDELHLTILSFINPCDWRVSKYSNYRLIAKQYAHVGAQVMFESFQFPPTVRALERMENILSVGLGKYFKTLDYEDELPRNEEGVKMVEGEGEQEENKEEQEVDAEEEEMQYIDDSDQEPPPHLLHPPAPRSSLQTTVFTTVLTAFHAAKAPINYIDAQKLHASALPLPLSLTPFLANLTQLELSVEISEFHPCPEMGIRALVANIPALEGLHLRFANDQRWHDSWRDPPALWAIVPLHDGAWGRMKSISLTYVTATESELIQLLSVLPQTLTCFHFEHIKLVKDSHSQSTYEVPLRQRR